MWGIESLIGEVADMPRGRWDAGATKVRRSRTGNLLGPGLFEKRIATQAILNDEDYCPEKGGDAYTYIGKRTVLLKNLELVRGGGKKNLSERAFLGKGCERDDDSHKKIM